MKRWVVIFCFILLLLDAHVLRGSHARDQSQERSNLREEVIEIWNGHYGRGDLEKWTKRLEKFRSMGNHHGVSLSFNVIGVIQYYEGDLDSAIDHLGRALEISRKHGPEKRSMMDFFWIGKVRMRQGLWREAVENLQESMRIANALGRTGRVGRCLRLIGLIEMGRGNYQGSMRLLEESLAVAKQNQDASLEMRCLHSIGRLHKKQGDYRRAGNYFNQSLELSRRLGDMEWVASNLSDFGDLSRQQADYESALNYYRQSLTLTESLDLKHLSASVYDKMGRVYLKSDDAIRALEYFQKSHDMAVSLGMRLFQALASASMGKAYGRMQKWEEALRETDKAARIFKEVDSRDHLRDCYQTKGLILQKIGEVEGAERNYKAAVEILETIREDVAGGEEELEAFMEKRSRVYRMLIPLLLEQGKVVEALEYLERSRLKELRDHFDRLKPVLRNKAEDEANEKERELREKIEGANALLTYEKSKPKDKQSPEKIAQLEKGLLLKKQQYIEYINDLRERFPSLASLLAIQPDTLIDIQRLLPPHVAIAQYLILDERLYIFVVTNQSLSHTEVNAEQTDLEEQIDHFRGLLTNMPPPSSRGLFVSKNAKMRSAKDEPAYEKQVDLLLDVSERLYRTLVKPIQKELSAFEVVGIIPNGRLHLLPFQALGERNQDGRFRFLIEEKAIFYLNSQSILKFTQKRAKQIGEKSHLIAFGNPDDSLEYAEEEIALIKEVFGESATYVKRDASEDKIKSKIPGFDIVHLATHAKMSEDVKRSYVLLAESSDGKEDGKLYLHEIWGLPLSECQLVTLSACDTARGKESSGDVMVSLETAFLRAGAPTIVASLWEVDDQATGMLMRDFYRHLMRLGKAEALREAQLSLKSDPRYSSPYFWAPFILVGDWL